MTQSAAHKHMFLADMEWLVMPALLTGQFRIWHETDKTGNRIPSAFASWAFLDEKAETRMKQGIQRLRPIDWKSGDCGWLIDLVAPFGSADKAFAELHDTLGLNLKTLSDIPKPPQRQRRS